jgi:hypothetical protein
VIIFVGQKLTKPAIDLEVMKKTGYFYLIVCSLALSSLVSGCTQDTSRPRLRGILKMKYTPTGQAYKACCQGPYGSGACSESGSLYTITYDLFKSNPGDPCTYTDMFPTPTPSQGLKK